MPSLFADVTPLRESRDFRLLFNGQLISMLGSRMTAVAIPFQVYHQTHSNAMVGLVSLVQLPFLVVGSLFGGAISDTRDKRRVLTVGGTMLAIFSAGLALNAMTAKPSLMVMTALASLGAAGSGFVSPARSAAIPRMVTSESQAAAYALNQVVIQIGVVVGPSVAGVLIATSGLATCYALDAVTFALFVLTSALIAPLPPTTTEVTSTWRTITQGLSYLRGHRLAQAVYLADLNAMIFGSPLALFPAMAITKFHGGSTLLGFLYAAPGVGALIGALTTGWVGQVERRGRAVTFAIFGWGLAIVAFGLSPWVWGALVAIALAGWADVIAAVFRNAILQSRITDAYRGRLSAIQIAVVTGGPRLGDLEAGAVAGWTSTSFSIVSGGAACAVGTFALAAWRTDFWRERASES